MGSTPFMSMSAGVMLDSVHGIAPDPAMEHLCNLDSSNLDGDAGCDPGYTSHSQGLAALANVSGHELSEALTDPRLNAWYDSGGAENADKCAWAFGPILIPFSWNTTGWKIQGNWSNSAYNSTTRGYANRSGQKGCIDGGTYN